MSEQEADEKADILEAQDRGEAISLMQPLLIADDSRHRGGLLDLAVELAGKAAGFRRSLPVGVMTALAGLVRAMNCYYSNLIEGHDTHPDIERALRNDYSNDAAKRDLQLEAKAHIVVQQWIYAGGLEGRAVQTVAICEAHRRFCEKLPEDMLWVEDAGTNERIRVVGGELRQRDVQVGRHVPISPGAVPRFLDEFARVYGAVGKADAILAAAAAHHRLLWIHPFLDGNGRVARDVACDAARCARHRRGVVGRAGLRTRRGFLQEPPCCVRSAPAQRSRRAGQSQ
jgi:hypothetical protein